MAKKVKRKKLLTEQILDKHKIAYESLELNALEGQLPKGIQADRIFKTLALTGDRTGPVIGIVPITDHLSEKKLARISGNKKVQMIPHKELQQITGYVHGANNPIGIRQGHRFPIFIDQKALELGDIIVSAGEIGRSIKLDSRLLARLVQAEFADIRDERQARN